VSEPTKVCVAKLLSCEMNILEIFRSGTDTGGIKNKSPPVETDLALYFQGYDG
jgi:hypothetical protein